MLFEWKLQQWSFWNAIQSPILKLKLKLHYNTKPKKQGIILQGHRVWVAHKGLLILQN